MAKKRKGKTLKWARALSFAHSTLQRRKGFDDGTKARIDAIMACKEGGNQELAERLEQDFGADVEAMLLHSCARPGMWRQTVSLLQLIAHEGPGGNANVEALVEVSHRFLPLGAWAHALFAWSSIEAGRKPPQSVYDGALSFGISSDAAQPEVRCLLRYMASKGLVGTDSCAVLFCSFAKRDMWRNALSLLQLVARESPGGTTNVNALIGVADHFLPLGAWAHALCAWCSMESGTRPSQSVYDEVLNLGVRDGKRREVLNLVRYMRMQGLKLTPLPKGWFAMDTSHDSIYSFWMSWQLMHENQPSHVRINNFQEAMMSSQALRDFHRKSKHLFDLHFMPSAVAQIAVKSLLAERWFTDDLRIITGRGRHSRHGSVLAPLIQKELRSYKAAFADFNPGRLVIPLGQLLVADSHKQLPVADSQKQLPVADSQKHSRLSWRIPPFWRGASQVLEQWIGWLHGHGVGASIEGINGRSWGRVVKEDYNAWVLDSGRIAKKHTLGEKWKWVRGLPPGVHACIIGWLRGRGVGASVEGIDGKRWGLAVEEVDNAWVLDTGRVVKKEAIDTKCKWVRGRPPFIDAQWSGWLRGRGVGASIESDAGQRLGLVVEEDYNAWVLDSGQTVQKKKMCEDFKWVRGLPPFVRALRSRRN